MDCYNFLLQYQSCEFHTLEEQEIYSKICDASIIDFYRKINGGGFFSNSLVIYPNVTDGFISIENINNAVNDKYSKYIGHRCYFGCDLFGNQYGYDANQIFFLNIESAETEILARSFEEFIRLISRNSDFYTGEPFAKSWNKKHGILITPERRLCPTYPFIIGGEYSIDHMYELGMCEVLDYNENIAGQIFGLPDGTNIEIKLTR